MTKTLSMVSHKKYNLNANEGFVIFFTSELITCFIDSFTLKMKSQSIAYLLNGSEHIYWILDLEDEVHSIQMFIWTIGLQECKEDFIFENRAEWAIIFGRDLKNLDLFIGAAWRHQITDPGPYPPSYESS